MSSLILLVIMFVVIMFFPQIMFLAVTGYLVFMLINGLRGGRRGNTYRQGNPYQQQGNPYQQNPRQSQTQRPKGDVIDVEFTESEVKEDQ